MSLGDAGNYASIGSFICAVMFGVPALIYAHLSLRSSNSQTTIEGSSGTLSRPPLRFYVAALVASLCLYIPPLVIAHSAATQGPPGAEGKAGPPGPSGPRGDPGAISEALDNRIAALVEDISALRQQNNEYKKRVGAIEEVVKADICTGIINGLESEISATVDADLSDLKSSRRAPNRIPRMNNGIQGTALGMIETATASCLPKDLMPPKPSVSAEQMDKPVPDEAPEPSNDLSYRREYYRLINLKTYLAAVTAAFNSYKSATQRKLSAIDQ